MTENKQFKIVNDCGDYHLLDGDEQLGYDLCSYSMRKANWNNVVDKLNEQDVEIKRLKDELQNLQTFKKILEYGEKSVDNGEWERYIEKEFEGL